MAVNEGFIFMPVRVHFTGGTHLCGVLGPCRYSRHLTVCASQQQRSGSKGMKKLMRKLVPLKAANGAAGSQNPAFRVVQWNTLADGLAQYGDFIKVRNVRVEAWPSQLCNSQRHKEDRGKVAKNNRGDWRHGWDCCAWLLHSVL